MQETIINGIFFFSSCNIKNFQLCRYVLHVRQSCCLDFSWFLCKSSLSSTRWWLIWFIVVRNRGENTKCENNLSPDDHYAVVNPLTPSIKALNKESESISPWFEQQHDEFARQWMANFYLHFVKFFFFYDLTQERGRHPRKQRTIVKPGRKGAVDKTTVVQRLYCVSTFSTHDTT